MIFALLGSLYATVYSLPVSTIVIDAGHGGIDPGAVGKNILEKDVTLAIAKRLESIIESESEFTPYLTRANDTYISLEDRVAISNSVFPGYDSSALCISIHVNGVKDESVQGYEILVRESKRAVPFITLDTPSWAISYFAHTSFSTLQRMVNQASYALSHAVHSSFSSTFPDRVDRGVKEQNVYVLQNSVWPSIVVEAGFITHKEESSLMSEDSWIDSVARSIFEGIISYTS